ncbi:SIMPL domain-containing protein [Sphingomonas sp. JC676]|uniref:SIMPL domain-containing protein n=1 Tax=Sphingomonas sp. JC676 TaxID=2768065 RepID=UPI0016586C51|nr:SIMPL domain-containing protein [Sphingomonas sp. JC676]MBC9034664.1 SIMPL domain-containing protein [Sphingomonas sp. JC676]
MKVRIAAAMLTAVFFPPHALAQNGVRAAAIGETVFHIAAEGRTRTRADDITLIVSVTGSGDTAEASRRAAAAKLETLTKALVAAGVDRGSITVSNVRQPFGFVGNEAYVSENVELPNVTMDVPAPRAKRSSAMLQIKLSDPARIEAVRAVLDSQGEAMSLPPLLSLKNDSTARRAAATDALARARAEADIYASALGLRVAGIAQLSNFASNPGEDPNYIQTMLAMQMGDPDNEVVTRARVTVDFILAPR